MTKKKESTEDEKYTCGNCNDSGLKCNICGANGDGGFSESSEVATEEIA